MLQALTDDRRSSAHRSVHWSPPASPLDLTRKAIRRYAGYVQVLDAQRLHQEAQLGPSRPRLKNYVDAVKLLLAGRARHSRSR